jgi:aminoglycoside/choline kinase family phosphotransferase
MLSLEEQQWLNDSLRFLSVTREPSMTGDSSTELLVEPLAGDASARHYYRVKLASRTFMFCRSHDHASNLRFRTVSLALEKAGVMAPLVFAFDDELGVMLLSDLGNTLLSDVYQMNAHAQPYSILHRVLTDLIRLARMPDADLLSNQTQVLAQYDQALLDRDFGLFQEWCLKEALGIVPTDQQQECLNDLADMFQQVFFEQPQVWVHRDFHCRNLMLTDNDIAVIDFQDMVKGPVTYDLISLVYDAYWLIPNHQKTQIIEDYYKLLTSERLIDTSLEEFKRWSAVTAMQRLLKILGIFCRLSLRDGKVQYLSDLPMVASHIDSLHETASDVWSESWLKLWNGVVKPALTEFLNRAPDLK